MKVRTILPQEKVKFKNTVSRWQFTGSYKKVYKSSKFDTKNYILYCVARSNFYKFYFRNVIINLFLTCPKALYLQ